MHPVMLSLTAAGIAFAAVMAFAENGRLLGRAGLPRDDREAARFYKIAADQGFAAAETSLGNFYAQGRGELVKTDVGDVNDIAHLLRTQIFACWTPPAEAAGVNRPVVVRITLNQDGSLTGEPVLVNSGSGPSQAAAASALLAVRRCQPFKLPVAKYDLWKDVEIMFDASIVR